MIRRTVMKMVNETVDEVCQIGELPTAIPAYDNLEFNFGIWAVQDGDVSKFISVTTGLVHKGIEIPDEGLERSWFKPKYELQVTDILPMHDHARMQQERRQDKVENQSVPIQCSELVLT